jgi:hypothetical protein
MAVRSGQTLKKRVSSRADWIAFIRTRYPGPRQKDLKADDKRRRGIAQPIRRYCLGSQDAEERLNFRRGARHPGDRIGEAGPWLRL